MILTLSRYSFFWATLFILIFVLFYLFFPITVVNDNQVASEYNIGLHLIKHN